MLDVLVVGAGPVGLFCANELNRHGLTYKIIDKKEGISEHSKALGLHIRTLDVLEDCGFIEKFLERGLKVESALLKSNGKELAEIDFKDLDTKRKYLIDLPQSETERILYDALEEKHNSVHWQVELLTVNQQIDRVMASVKNPDGSMARIEARWIIACDGSHSTLRHLMNADFHGSKYQQHWWLADLHIDWPIPENKMIINISHHGPLACFPMGNKRYRVVLTAPTNDAKDPSFEDIVKEFNLRTSDHGVLSDPIWLSAFAIHHRQLQHYRFDRIFFAGDAAHIHSPLGGQGLNTGIQDIYNLVWKIALVQKGQSHVDLLNSYNDERHPVGKDVISKTNMMTKMILIKNDILINMRNFSFKFLANISSIKNAIAYELAELKISYAKSFIVHHFGEKIKFNAGEFIPDFNLRPVHGDRECSMLEITEGTKHHLFFFIGKENVSPTKVQELAHTLGKQYEKVMVVHLIMTDNVMDSGGIVHRWIDVSHNVHNKYSINKTSVLLIRPDKYIGLTQTPLNNDELLDYFSGIFI